MSAGLPGLGLGGLFFIVSALVAPLVELVRTLRGTSRPGAWRGVWRQFAMALTMIAAIDLTLRALLFAVGALGLGGTGGEDAVTVLPVAPIAITLGLLALVLAAVKILQLALRVRALMPPERPAALGAPLPSRARLAAGGAVLASAWFALLAFGASQLSPLGGSGRAEGPAATPAATPAPFVHASRRPNSPSPPAGGSAARPSPEPSGQTSEAPPRAVPDTASAPAPPPDPGAAENGVQDGGGFTPEAGAGAGVEPSLDGTATPQPVAPEPPPQAAPQAEAPADPPGGGPPPWANGPPEHAGPPG